MNKQLLNSQSPIRKIFDVLIYDKAYDVYDIPGKEHEGFNDIPKTWWLYYSDRMPEGAFPPVDSREWKPFDSGIHRRVWDITFKQKNYTKNKWDELQFRSSTIVQMSCNGRVVYEFTTGGSYLHFAMAKAQTLIVKMEEHPYNFFEPEKEDGRKIYYKGLPALVRPNMYHPGEITIEPDYTCGFTKEAWWTELYRREQPAAEKYDDIALIEKEKRQEDFESGYINWGDALADGYINWFRK